MPVEKRMVLDQFRAGGAKKICKLDSKRGRQSHLTGYEIGK